MFTLIPLGSIPNKNTTQNLLGAGGGRGRLRPHAPDASGALGTGPIDCRLHPSSLGEDEQYADLKACDRH